MNAKIIMKNTVNSNWHMHNFTVSTESITKNNLYQGYLISIDMRKKWLTIS